MYNGYSSGTFEKKYTYPGNDLGAVWYSDKTAFRVWAPNAEKISIRLYHSGTEGSDDLLAEIEMAEDINGTWAATVPGDLNGVYYTYFASVEGKQFEVCDPYAVTTGVNGKRAMIIDLRSTNPDGWENDQTPVVSSRYTDYVLYELHIRDFSISRYSGIAAKGKYLGLAETGTKTGSGYPTGLDHIRQLGVTHVHLLPVYDFGSVDEAALEKKEYNWGYDPVNYNVPEGSYSTDPFDGFKRVRELKEMIHAFHSHGLAVVLDVVYNHVFHTYEFSINQLVPGYFSRQNDRGALSNGSSCGNDTASERAMVRKYIVDSVNFWADEYHVDGFRFDLVGLLDVHTIHDLIKTVRKAHPHVMFYGEGWDIPTQLTKQNESLAIQQNAAMLPEFAFFNDRMRDTMRGSVFDCHQLGYVSGASISKEQLFNCFRGYTQWTSNPEQIVNYVSCHDNHTLHDRIALALPDVNSAELARRCRLAAAFNLLSLGIPFFQAGEEMLRSKKNASGRYVENSYRSPERVNEIKWLNRKDPEIDRTVAYYQGLLKVRKQYPVFRINNAEDRDQKVRIYETMDATAAFLLRDDHTMLLAAYNPSIHDSTVTLPFGTWGIIVNDHLAGTNSLGAVAGSISVPPLSAVVLVLS